MNADGQLLFEIRDLCKSFGDIEVLKNINTTISQGEVVVIVGPSGSGKSTFLRSLNLLEEPTGGQILFEGKDITDPKANINLYRQHIGMVFQHFNLFPHKTILQNMTLAPVQLLKRSKKEAEEEAMKLLERVGLPEKANAYPSQLSGGQKQRIAIVRSLCMHPDVMLFDEPTSALDPEMEYEDLANNLGGCFIDLMGGQFIINPLEPKTWDDTGSPEDMDAPQTFRIRSRLSQHISFLKDFFRTYKDFTDREIDVIEIMLQKLYAKWEIRDQSDFSRLGPQEYPILSDLYHFIESEFKDFNENSRQLYTAEMLQGILLGLHSMCVGAESKFFNGHTNITDSSFVAFGVKGLLQASRSLKNALLFNVLSFMSNELLTEGNTAASLDEFYLFLSNLTAVEYVRNFMKRVRKKDSAVIIASQNLEDFNLDGVREYTKPLFSIPTHQFLFNAGSIDARFYTDTLQLEESEYNLIRYPQRGVCLYKCGNERYNLMVNAPDYKARLFGKAGGR